MPAKKNIFCLLLCFSLTACLDLDQIQQSKKPVKENSILLLNITDVITGELSEEFMKYVRLYASKSQIKGVLIRVNSPGGTVGASQEINSTISEVRNFYKKPVFVSGGNIVASGAVYSVVSADKIFVNPGTLFGSIGVLMRFQNVSDLVRWAKMEVYSLKSGEFKDSGSPFRKMTLRERELFEKLLESTLDQFKEAIIKGRKLESKMVERFADGRIFSGREALEFGLVDSLGSFNQAIQAIGKTTGLGSKPKLFDPGAKSAYERFFENFSSKSVWLEKFFSLFNHFEKLSYGQPLYILPSYLSPQ